MTHNVRYGNLEDPTFASCVEERISKHVQPADPSIEVLLVLFEQAC